MTDDDRLIDPPTDETPDAKHDLDIVFDGLHDVLGEYGLHDLRPFARDLHAIALGRLEARQLHAMLRHDHLHQHRVAKAESPDGDHVVTHEHLHDHDGVHDHEHLPIEGDGAHGGERQ